MSVSDMPEDMVRPWAPGYKWTQTESWVTISMEVAENKRVPDIDVNISATEIKAGVEGEPLRIAGQFHMPVAKSECTWQLERKRSQGYSLLEIHIEKQVNVKWKFPIKEDCSDGTYMDAQSHLELAKHYEEIQDFNSALKHLELAVERGHVSARVKLGNLYRLGKAKSHYPVDVNVELALEHYSKAAEMGSGEAMALLGWLYQEGLGGVPRSHKEAAKWYKKCVDPNQSAADACLDRSRTTPAHTINALFNLGIIYQGGSSDLPIEFSESVKHWQQAARYNFPPAIYNLGIMLMNGKGVEKDMEQARLHFFLANKLNPELVVPQEALETSSVSTTTTPGTQSPAEPASQTPEVRQDPLPASGEPGTGMLDWVRWGVAFAALVGAFYFHNVKK